MIKELVLRYLEYLEIEKNKSQKTITNYSFYLNRFLEFAKIGKAEEITPLLVRQFKVSLNRYRNAISREPLKRVTINYHLIALRSFLKYCLRIEELAVISADKVELLDEEDREVKVLRDGDLERLLSAPKLTTPEGRRDRAILELLFSAGLRVSELVRLNVNDVNPKTNEFTVRGKGGYLRVAFISQRAAWALKAYLAKREDNRKPLFIRYRGPGMVEDKLGESFRLSSRSIEDIVKKYSRISGIMSDPSPHTLRHSFATDLLRSGADLRSVQELLGHKNVATTQIYTHVTNPQLKAVHQKFHRGNRR